MAFSLGDYFGMSKQYDSKSRIIHIDISIFSGLGTDIQDIASGLIENTPVLSPYKVKDGLILSPRNEEFANLHLKASTGPGGAVAVDEFNGLEA